MKCLILGHDWVMKRTPRLVFVCSRCDKTRDTHGNPTDYALAR